jgi:hypothetical protein
MLMLNTNANNEFDMEAMKIKFGGQTNQIEANTLINTLIHFTNVVQEVSNGLSHDMHTDKKVEIKIKALEPGSFNVAMDFVTSTVGAITTFFTKDTLSYAANLVQTVGGVYNLAKFLKGNKPASIERTDNSIKIENNSGEVKYFDFRGANIYLNNPTIKEAISQQFDTLENDPNVSDFELLDKDSKPLFEADKKEFLGIASNEETISTTSKVKSVKAHLRIISLSWELRKKWEFYYEGNRIAAKIKDDTFAELIKKGEAFAMGDALEVEMDIVQELDDVVSAYVNKSYTVNHIVRHLKRSEQTDLDFPAEQG